MSSLLDRRLVIVTGKGGTGKTTVTTALGLLAERRGKRAILCEIGGGHGPLGSLVGGGGEAGRSRRITPGLSAISIDPEKAKRDYLERQFRSGMLAGLLTRSRMFQLLTAASPGLAELLTIGNVWDLARIDDGRRGESCDLVLLDAPATGAGLALLHAPSTYARVAKVGPIHRDAMRIDRFLHDRALTAVVGVALPEEMPVNETLELEARLGEEALGLDAVVVNGLYPERFSGDDAKRIAGLDRSVPPSVRPALAAALSEYGHARAQRSAVTRLRRGLEAPVTTLPFLFEPEVGLGEIEQLTRYLEHAL
jgi:anion-transporting  ArsA/GET3 family ATPase